MHRRETYILTRYSEISDAQGHVVRGLQAEVARGILRGLRGALLCAVRWVSSNKDDLKQPQA